MTFVYFIPTTLKLMANETLPKSEPVATAVQWVHLGYMRHAAILVAWLTALKAFSLMSKHVAEEGTDLRLPTKIFARRGEKLPTSSTRSEESSVCGRGEALSGKLFTFQSAVLTHFLSWEHHERN